MINISKNNRGSMLVLVIIATGLFSIIAFGSISIALLQKKLNTKRVLSNQALHVAEAGVNYYRWVLYHDGDEYCNKEACIPDPFGPYGPYDYTDITGTITGQYELYITPPAENGSTIVNIKSIGWMLNQPAVKRSIEVKVGIPSWSTYSTLCNSDIRFGEGTEVWGPIHSNGGIRFDGLAHNLISSSLLDYHDPDHSGPNEFAVHTHHGTTDPLPDGNNPPLNVPTRNDVFMAGRSFPAPTISFDLLDSHINDLYGLATTSGIMLGPSGGEGYHVVISPNPGPNNDQLDIYRVNNISSTCSGEGTYRIDSETFLQTSIVPSNGVVYFKDHLWIEGQVNEDRVTFLAFQDPITTNVSNIILNHNLLYTNYDGRDAIGLIAQNNVLVGLFSENDLRIDAALIAKEGRIGRNYYSSFCSSTYYKRNSITITGSLATKGRYGFAYTDGTGYQTRNLIYDNNLTFIPPPHFPTTGEYTFISWKEN